MVQKEETKIRCFIAIDLPYEIRENLQYIQEELRKENLFFGKYTEPENIHLTLKFLGEIGEEKVEEVKKYLQKISFQKFSAAITNLGVFSEHSLRIIWVQSEGKALIDLQQKIDNLLSSSFPKEQRFMGHITIARAKNVKNKEKLLNALKKINMEKNEWVVHTFVLRKSVLTPHGPLYEDLARYSLKN